MGFDYEKGEFTSESYAMLPAQVARLVFELDPGDSAIVRTDSVWVDNSYDKETWINGYAEALCDNQVIANGESDPEIYARLHCVKNGLVLDNSHLNQRFWGWDNNLYHRQDQDENSKVFPLPVIHCIFNSDELEIVRPALIKNGIELNNLLSITQMMEAIDDAEDLEDDIPLEEADGDNDEKE